MEAVAVTANELLFWMSARGQGSWSQFRAAIEELRLCDTNRTLTDDEENSTGQSATPAYQLLRLNLQRLGHAEFFAGAGDSAWRVAPPALAATEHRRGGWLGVVVGARSPRLLQRIEEAMSEFEHGMLEFENCPHQIWVLGPSSRALAALAEGLGLHLQKHAPAAILTSLPAVDHPAVRRPASLPFGSDWRVERFSPSRLGWTAATREDAASASLGIYRFSLRYQRHVYLCSKGSAFLVPVQAAKYIMLGHRRLRVLEYDPVNCRLYLPAICRPPFLIERALILCSASPPIYEAGPHSTGSLSYHDVPRAIANIAAALLRQEIRCVIHSPSSTPYVTHTSGI